MKNAYTTMNSGDLNAVLTTKREALRSNRFGSAGARTKNVKEQRTLRKDIARILTSLRVQSLAKVASVK